MKRRMIMAGALCLSLLSLSCCAQQQEQTTQQSDPIPEQSVPAKPEQPAPVQDQPAPEPEPEQPAEPVYEIPTGVWLAATDVGYSNYYYFNAEEQSGRYVSLDYGLGMPFSYDGSGKQLVFFLGDEAAAHPASLEETGQDSFKLVWEDNLPETLTFVREGTLEDFHFYSNDELARMAMEHYADEEDEDETPPSQYGVMTNEDNTVTVQLYDNLGDHNSTSAWYIVDRFTAMGTDLLTGEEIDLLAEEESALPEEPPVEEEAADAPSLPTGDEEAPAEEQSPVEGEEIPAAIPETSPNL